MLIKQLDKFVTCTQPLAAGQPQSAVPWGQECHRSPAREEPRYSVPSPAVDGGCTVGPPPAGTGAQLESCERISPRHPPSSTAPPLQRVPGSQITDLGRICPPSAAAAGTGRALGQHRLCPGAFLAPLLHTGGLEGLSPGHPAGLVLDALQIHHRDVFLKAHSRLYPQQSAAIRRVKPKAFQGTFPTAATAHGGGSSGTHSDPAASCLALAGVGLVGGTSSVSSS